MNSEERHQSELTVRKFLRDSIDRLQQSGKNFDEIRGFVVRFVDEQIHDLTIGHRALTVSLSKEDSEKIAAIKEVYDELCLALKNCRDVSFAEIKYREEKNAQKETQPR